MCVFFVEDAAGLSTVLLTPTWLTNAMFRPLISLRFSRTRAPVWNHGMGLDFTGRIHPAKVDTSTSTLGREPGIRDLH